MELISRKGGGLPQNYAETSSWLNPAPWRAIQLISETMQESLRPTESIPVPAMAEGVEGQAQVQSRGRRRRRR